MDKNLKTDFGYQQILVAEKVHKVAQVFDSVATRYDLMNDVMSLGMHRLWKKFTIALSAVKTGQKILDLASGTGDLAAEFAQRVGEAGYVYLVDINANMLQQGRIKLDDQGIVSNVYYAQANAEQLPFPDDYFDCISIAFGLRNVTNKSTALRAMQRVLKPGGRLLVLEFSHLMIAELEPLYDFYSLNILPKLGQYIAQDSDSYRYLAESIRRHPDQDTLKNMILEADFDQCDYYNLSGGIVALHRAYKY